MPDKRESNRRYYERTRDRIIIREHELRPSTIIELLDCLRAIEPHTADRRVERLELLYRDITGDEPP